MSELLKWELEWIDKNTHRYEGPLHAASVKRNIEKRYFEREARSLIRVFNEKRTTGSRIKVLQHFGHSGE